MSRETRTTTVLYVVSRFPNVTETFVVNEWWALEGRFRMELASLIRERVDALHPQTERLLPRVHFAPLLGLATVRANLSALRSRPRPYLTTLRDVLAGSRGRPNGGLLKGLVVFWKAVSLARLVEEKRVDHVHAHFISHPATAAWVVHRLTGVPFSITAHANDLFVQPALLERKIEEARFVATISEFNRDHLGRAAPRAGRIELVHCGVDLDRFPFRPGRGASRLLSVGRLEPTKGHDDLLRAFAEVAAGAPDVSLEIVGSGPERHRLERLVEDLGLAGRVRLRGALTTEDVRELFAEADMFVLAARRHPSGRMDGIPVALMEAMASGLPVVTTSLSGIPELVVDEETGLLVPPESPPQLAAAIRRLLAEPALRERLVAAARERVAARFDLTVEAARLGDLFDEAARERVGFRDPDRVR